MDNEDKYTIGDKNYLAYEKENNKYNKMEKTKTIMIKKTNNKDNISRFENSKLEQNNVTTIKETPIKVINIKKKLKRLKLQRKKIKLEDKIKLQKKLNSQKKTEYTMEKKAKAAQVSSERLLTDEDFKKIDITLIKQQVTYPKRGIKRSFDNEKNKDELIKLADIENIYKKRKHDKQARIESVKVLYYILLHLLYLKIY